MDVKKAVEDLIQKYGTNNPFALAKNKNIHIIYINLGGKFGNYVRYKREKFILIDDKRTPPAMLNFICAHELGHALCTPKENTQWLKTYTMSVNADKVENIANAFAVELLLPDTYLKEYSDFSIYELARNAGVPKEFVRLKKINYRIKAPANQETKGMIL